MLTGKEHGTEIKDRSIASMYEINAVLSIL